MRISVHDAAIDVDVSGSGEAVVLLHGFPLNRDIWDETARALAQRMRVIRPDLRGMGRSSVPAGPYLMETLAGDVAGMLDALGVERCSIVGHSLGGYVALAFCRMYAERVERLALICSRLAADSREAAQTREGFAQRLDAAGLAAVDDAQIARLFAPYTGSRRPRGFDRAWEIAHTNDPRGLAAMARGMAQRLASDDIAEDLAMPVLVAAGAHDAIVPPAEARDMAAAFPHAALRIMAQSGHMPMLEEPEDLTAVLLAFLTGAETG